MSGPTKPHKHSCPRGGNHRWWHQGACMCSCGVLAWMRTDEGYPLWVTKERDPIA